MIVECTFTLTGIVLTFNEKLNTLKIDHIYRAKAADAPPLFVIQHGRDGPTALSFSQVATAFSDAYASVVRKIWTRGRRHVVARYYQLTQAGSPELVGLGGCWAKWAER